MAKSSFTINLSFYKPISMLSDEQLGKLFRAIFQYQIGLEVDIGTDKDVCMAFEFFRSQFEIEDREAKPKNSKSLNNRKLQKKAKQAIRGKWERMKQIAYLIRYLPKR